MPFPTIRNGSVFSGKDTNDTSFSISVPDHEDGDVLYTVFCQDGGSGVFTYTGWTLLLGPVDLAGTGTAAMYYRPASAEPASYTLTSTVSERAAWATWAVTNDDGISGTPLSGGGAGATAIPFANYTTGDPACLVICVGVTDADTRPWGLSLGIAPSMQLGIFGTTSGATVGLYYFYAPKAATYVISDPSITGTQAAGRLQIAIKPADADPSPAPSPVASTVQRLRTYPHP